MARLAAGLLVNALVRRVGAAGGNAAVLARGDATAGALLLILTERGRDARAVERGLGPAGESVLVPVGPAGGDESALTDYWRRRRARDPDLWVVELDIASAERFAAETILDG